VGCMGNEEKCRVSLLSKKKKRHPSVGRLLEGGSSFGEKLYVRGEEDRSVENGEIVVANRRKKNRIGQYSETHSGENRSILEKEWSP